MEPAVLGGHPKLQGLLCPSFEAREQTKSPENREGASWALLAQMTRSRSKETARVGPSSKTFSFRV